MAKTLSLETYAPLDQRPLAKLGDVEPVGHRQRSEDANDANNDPAA
jgi:hypothetical protein